MAFEPPRALEAYDNFPKGHVNEGEESWDHIGAPLDGPVERTVPEYDAKLELNLDPKPGRKRWEIADLRWGKIESDAVKLQALGDAVANISAVIKKGKDQLAHDWKGKSFDAFRTSMEQLEGTLNEYSKAVKAAGEGLYLAMTKARILYGDYKTKSQDGLKFDGSPPPNDWWKFNDGDADFMASRCTSHGGMDIVGGITSWGMIGNTNCTYNDGEQKGVIVGKLVNRPRYDQLEKWDCTNDPGVSLSQYRDTVSRTGSDKQVVQDKIHAWYEATDHVKNTVDKLHRAALDNLKIIANRHIFSHLETPGAPAGNPNDQGGDDTGGRTDSGGHTGSPGPTDSGGPGSTGGPGTPTPGPTPQPEPMPQPEPQPEPQPDPSQQTDPQTSETVTIEDGDHKISVTSPDGEGTVKVTVDDGTGKPKTYEMNFGDGTGTDPAGTPGIPGTPGQDPARTLPYPTDGSTGGSGTGQQQPGQQEPGQQQPGQDEPGAPGADGQTGDEAIPVEPGPDGKCVISDPPLTITAERPPGTTDTVVVTVDDGTGNPTTYRLDYSDGPTGGQATPIAQPLRGGTPDADTRAVPGADQPFAPTSEYRMPISGDLASGADAGPVPAGAPEPAAVGPANLPGPIYGGPEPPPGFTVAEPMPGDLPAAAAQPAETAGLTAAQGNLPGDAPATGFGGTAGGAQAGAYGLPDGSPYTEVPAQATPGEAGLASASDGGAGSHQGQSGAMAGGGMPMMAGAGAGGGGGDTDRAGSQWRTSGDLFDDTYAEPAGRFGGVLDSDDGPRR